ncbi:hypothetical protein B0H14DRAFT_3476609 [Mycena olivaceomarginata]|nr:hypothetical protein B0H14DRAFT_3487619 [Mycena olivaceomarginata]KAJ7814963.1 hypothetical protein B0H14DRAFT_3476609 [Mycena olivaceomarginata]
MSTSRKRIRRLANRLPHPDSINDLTLWPEKGIEMPTLQEFMVRDTDIYPHATIPVGKVLVDIDFEQRATSLMLEAERRRHRAIEKKRGERTFKRSGEVEGKLSVEQRAKLALKQKSAKDDYEKHRAAKEAEAANPLGEGLSGSSAVNGDTNIET